MQQDRMAIWSSNGQVADYMVYHLFASIMNWNTVLTQSQMCLTGFSLYVIWSCWHFSSHSVALLHHAFCSLPALVAQKTSVLQGLYISKLSLFMLVNITMLIWWRNVALIFCQLFFSFGGRVNIVRSGYRSREAVWACWRQTEGIFTLPLFSLHQRISIQFFSYSGPLNLVFLWNKVTDDQRKHKIVRQKSYDYLFSEWV